MVCCFPVLKLELDVSMSTIFSRRLSFITYGISKSRACRPMRLLVLLFVKTVDFMAHGGWWSSSSETHSAKRVVAVLTYVAKLCKIFSCVSFSKQRAECAWCAVSLRNCINRFRVTLCVKGIMWRVLLLGRRGI
jgi:hypothetical protein